jgi:hypothetical protein
VIFYGLIYAEPGDFNFEGVGSSIATWTEFESGPTRPVIDPDAAHPDLLWSADEPAFVAGVIDGDHLYGFACEQVGLGRPCTLARAPLDRVQEHDAWEWWDGSAFGDGAHAELFQGAPILSVSFNPWLGAWLAVYSPPFDGVIYGRTAPELTGPWSEAAVLYDPPADTPYDANPHPDLETDGRTLYLTYSRPHGDRWFATEFPWIEVELE